MNFEVFKDYQPPNWDEWFIRQVYLVSEKSKDKSSKIGSVIVKDNQIVKIGYNGFPIGIDDSIQERYERPLKYQFVSHAETNSILFAARDGVSTKDCILYTNGISCIQCSKSIIQAGIKKLIYHKQFQDFWNQLYREEWKGHEEISRILLKEAKIELIPFDKILNVKGYIDGKIINL